MDVVKFLEIIAWPLSTLIIVIIVLIMFKKEIAEKIKTIKSVSKNGVLMDQSQETKMVDYNSYEDLLGKNDSITVREQKDLITNDLEKRNLTKEHDETIKVLVHQLAITQLKLQFERIYNIIFGSQIYLLKKLNENSKPKKDIDLYITNIIKEYDSLNDWTNEEYLNFLFFNSLIIYDDKKEIYSITNIGHEFLLWLLNSGNNEDKKL